MALSKEAHELASYFVTGAQKTFANAEALFSEATILANAKAWARALFMHQISLEECAKVDMLTAATVSLLLDFPVDSKRLRRAFLRHESKNRVNAFFLDTSEEEVAARATGDIDKAVDAFEAVQDAFHRESNALKNASLYVDFGDEVHSPLELIDEQAFVRVRKRNEEFMAMSFQKVDMLTRWAKDLDQAAANVSALMAELDLDALRLASQGQWSVFEATFEAKFGAMVERWRAKSGDR